MTGPIQQARPIRVAVDLCAFSVTPQGPGGQLQVVLVRLQRPPFAGQWALPGGLIGAQERVEDAAVREMREKTGIEQLYIEQLYTFSDPARDPLGRCISVAHLGLVPPAAMDLRSTEKYSGIAWFPVSDVKELAYDHRQILDYAVSRLQSKLSYTNIAYSLLPEEFTLPELQKVYEAIHGRPLDTRNFRRRLHELDLLADTGRMRQAGPGRPARLYRFRSRSPQTVQML